MRKAVTLLVAGVLAAVLGSGLVAAAAQAATAPQAISPAVIPVPTPGNWSEIFPPFINPTSPKCLDEPNGSSSGNLQMQIYHCHGYASNGAPQRWFWQLQSDLGNGNVYRLVSANTGLCLGVPSGPPHPGTPVVQDGCQFINFFEWVLVLSSNAPHFQLQMWDFPSLCMGLANTSGNDHTGVVLQTCQTPTVFNEPSNMTWQIG